MGTVLVIKGRTLLDGCINYYRKYNNLTTSANGFGRGKIP